MGHGECWDLASESLKHINAKWNGRYIFGKEISGIDHIDKIYWPKGINNYKAWDNDAVSKMFYNLVDGGLKQPFFLFIHINGRYDQEVSNRVKEIITTLETEGNYSESIIILNSDHGIPDPHPDRRKFYYDWMIKNNIPMNRHDMIMTDDNILIPLWTFLACHL